MSTLTTQERPTITPPSLLQASGTVVWRNLIHIRRMPEMLLDVTLQPVMFVLLFAYVFGGSIATAAPSYREFLLPGDHGPDDRVLLGDRRDGAGQ